MTPQTLHKIRSLLFSPESRFELLARSFYHRIAATKTHFRIQDWLARRSYRRWLAQRQKCSPSQLESSWIQPKVTFLVDGKQAPISHLHQTLKTIMALQGDEWEAFVIPPCGEDRFELPYQIESDRRIKVIRDQVNLIEVISGAYVLFCQSGDLFFNDLLGRFYDSINQSGTGDLIYFDSEVCAEDPSEAKPLFKPSTLSQTLLLSVNYLSRSFIRTETLRNIVKAIDPKEDLLLQEYDIILRLCERNPVTQHIPHLLVSQPGWVTPKPETYQEVAKNHLVRQGLEDVNAVEQDYGTRFTWKSGNPKVAIIILTKNHPKMLRNLIDSIFANTHEQPFEIKVIDNNSDNHDVLAYFEELEKFPNIQIIPYPKTFNYSEANNLGVAHSDSDLVLLLNDDMRVIYGDWLSELSQWAIRPEVGVVGAKLIRANHTIQHTGLIMGLTGFVGHAYLNAPEHYFGLWGSADWYREVMAVTGACQMFRRKVFEEAGGYNEDYRIAFGDVDFCLRVRELGYQNIMTPFNKLFHYEGQSRGYITPVTDILKGYEEFEPYLIEDDPYFSPNLTYTRIPKCAFEVRSRNDRLDQIETRKNFYLKK